MQALRHNRDYRLLMTGSTVSMIGTGMSELSMSLVGYATTHSVARAALVEAVFGAGQLLLSLPAGALVDRWPRRRVLVLSSVVNAVLYLGVPVALWLHRLDVRLLLVLAALTGMGSCFYAPAERAAIKQLLDPDQLGDAMAVNQARASLGSLVGPSLGGTLFGISRALPFLGDALTHLWAAGCAALVRAPLPAPQRTEQHLARDLAEGLRWLWRSAATRQLLVIALLLNCGFNGVVGVAWLVLQQGGTSAAALGLLGTAIGASGLLGALLAPWLLRRGPVGRIALWGMSFTVLAGFMVPMRQGIWWIGSLLCAVMLVLPAINSGLGAFQSRVTPDAMQGRASSAAGFVGTALIPVATALGGVLLARFGRVDAMLVFVGVLAAALVVIVRGDDVRSIPRTSEFAALAEIPVDEATR